MINIAGERVTLRTCTREEYHALRRAYVPDPVMDPNPYTYDPAKTDAAFERNAERADWYPRVGIFVDGELGAVGELSFKRIDREKGRCELGIALSNDGVKRRGYGTEALRLAIGYAFGELGLSNIYADTMGGNAVMRHIFDKLGFRRIGTEPRFYDMGGRFEDRLDYVLDNVSKR